MPHVKKPILVAKIAINAAIAELQINGIAKLDLILMVSQKLPVH